VKTGAEGTRDQVAKVLQSETLRSSEVLRRLLKFLAEKSLSDEADQLKEYTIGVDALGKPEGYDPRQDSGVRIQVGRLRQKLAEYYRTEGKDDALVLEVPKGHFRIDWRDRSMQASAESGVGESGPSGAAAAGSQLRRLVRILAVALGVAVLWGTYCTVRLWREAPIPKPTTAVLPPEIEELWHPVLSSSRPLIISASASLFVGMQGVGLYREPGLNRWEDVLTSPRVGSVRRLLDNPSILPIYYYTGYGNMTAAFRLGQLLGWGRPNTSMARSDLLTWQQVVDSNVIFLGPSRLNAEQLRSVPLELQYDLDDTGVRNRRPSQGEPAHLADNYASIREFGPGTTGDSGEVYALVTHGPGPLGTGDIECFNSNHNPGTMGAVLAFTTPELARMLVAKLRKPDGRLPPYYQILLSVKFKDTVPTGITYVTHCELHTEGHDAKRTR